MKKVFISYARENQEFAVKLSDNLEKHGFNVWIDLRSILGGVQWTDAIIEGILQSEVAIICLSVHSVESDWVRREIFLARSLKKRVIPIMLTNCFEIMKHFDETKWLLGLQIVDFQTDYEKAFQTLLRSLGVVGTQIPILLNSNGVSLVKFRQSLSLYKQKQ